MIKIAICDDSKYIRNINRKLIAKYSIVKKFDCVIDEYENGEMLLKNVDEYNLIFLDYEFEDKGENGIEIARKIRNKNDEVDIVFLSSYPNVVFDAFEVRTFRFLVKPVKEEKIFETLDDYIEQIEKNRSIIVDTSGEKRVVKENQITFIEGYGKKSIINTVNKENSFECKNTLSYFEKTVSKKTILRCHKSYLVNMKYIESFGYTEIVLFNGSKIPMSRQKYKEFKESYKNFLLQSYI